MDAASILILLSVSGWSVAAYAWFIRKTDETTTLRQQLAKSEARVVELEGLIYRKCEHFILRKQAEAVEAATKACEIKSATDDSRCYSVALLGYADRLKRKAAEAERAGGEQ